MKKLHQNSSGGAKYKLVSLLLKKRVLHTSFSIEYQRDKQNLVLWKTRWKTLKLTDHFFATFHQPRGGAGGATDSYRFGIGEPLSLNGRRIVDDIGAGIDLQTGIV